MYYEFREAQPEELGACFELRKECYSTKVLRGFVDCGEFQLHDDHARHFGLFRNEGDSTHLVGYARVVEAFPENPRLPLLSHGWSNQARVQRMMRRLLDKHGMVVEGGRLSVERSKGDALVAKVAAEGLTCLYVHGFEVPSLLIAAAHHRRFYESLGFRQIFPDEVVTVPWKSSTTSLCMLRCPRSTASCDPRLSRMLEAYILYGAIAFHPDDLDNFAPDTVNHRALQSSSRLALVAAA